MNASDILKQLDDRASRRFPVMDEPKSYMAACRLTAFSKPPSWAMTIEQLMFVPRGSSYDRFRVVMFKFGDVLDGAPGSISSDYVYPIAVGDDGDFIREQSNQIQPGIYTARIRSKAVGFDCRIHTLAARKILRRTAKSVAGQDVLRLLALDHRDELLATESERRNRFRDALPILLQLDEWHHPDIMEHEIPKRYPVFRNACRSDE